MKAAPTALMILTLFILLLDPAFCQFTSSIGETRSVNNYQSVGGDFGRSWIMYFQEKNQPGQDTNSNSTPSSDPTNLWDWGTLPKGKTLQNGTLVNDNNYSYWYLNLSSNWLGENYVDPETGKPIYQLIPIYSGSENINPYAFLPPGTEITPLT